MVRTLYSDWPYPVETTSMFESPEIDYLHKKVWCQEMFGEETQNILWKPAAEFKQESYGLYRFWLFKHAEDAATFALHWS